MRRGILTCLVLLQFAAAAPAAARTVSPIEAHRGGTLVDGVPRFAEGSMEAFRGASRDGYTLDMDTRLTSDGVPVVFSDARLDRLTRCSGLVSSKTLAQLMACPPDVLGSPGSGQPTAPSASTAPVATLADALAFAAREGAYVSLEINSVPGDPDFDGSSRFAGSVMAVVRASGQPRDRLIVQSEWPPNLDVARAQFPGVATGIITSSQLNAAGQLFAAGGGHGRLSPAWPVSPGYVSSARTAGLEVVPYTLNTEPDVRAGAATGANALVTDDPARAQRVLGLTRRQLAPDGLAPTARIRAPRFASDVARGRRFRVRISGSDRGSGLAALRLEVRSNATPSARWRPVGRDTLASGLRFRGGGGGTYLFRLTAIDRFDNTSGYAYALTSVPLDDRSSRLRYSSGWRRSRSARPYGGEVHRANQAGVSMRLHFRGARVVVIAPRTSGGGRLRVEVDGHARVVSLRGRAQPRRVVFRSGRLGAGVHRLRVVALGPGSAIDAVAIERGPAAPR